MNYKIIFLASAAILMGACSDREEDISQAVGDETATPAYVAGDENTANETTDMIEGDGSEVPNDNAVVDTMNDTGPANLDQEQPVEDDPTMRMETETDIEVSPETSNETSPQ